MPFHRYPIDIRASYTLNREFEPLEAHVILWGIEQSLMPRETGKRWEWEIASAAHDTLAMRFQDFDWADEVLHAQMCNARGDACKGCAFVVFLGQIAFFPL